MSHYSQIYRVAKAQQQNDVVLPGLLTSYSIIAAYALCGMWT